MSTRAVFRTRFKSLLSALCTAGPCIVAVAGPSAQGAEPGDLKGAEGACCNLSSGACASSDSGTCYASGGVFLGAGTTCASAPCCSQLSACTGSNRAEGEPSGNCVTLANTADPNRDLFNSGCDHASHGFSTVVIGDRVCGRTSQFAGVPDADWYETTVAGAPSYIGFSIGGCQAPMTITMYRQESPGFSCPVDPARLPLQQIATDSTHGCADVGVVGDCLPAGTYFVQVRPTPGTADIPCEASYVLAPINDVCLGAPVGCTVGNTPESEPGCHLTASNEGCNSMSPSAGSFVSLACAQTACGTVDLQSGTPDTDWFAFTHAGGALNVTLNCQFFGSLAVHARGNTGPQGCGDLVTVGTLAFVRPNQPRTLEIPALPPSDYYVVVTPDPRGPRTVACGATYTLRVECGPHCPCQANLVDTSPTDQCRVNTPDLTIVLANFGKQCPGRDTGQPLASPGRCPTGYLVGDFDFDGIVNTADLSWVLGAFGKQNINGVCQ